jgi:ATP-binding cassette, subfamily B, bacterial
MGMAFSDPLPDGVKLPEPERACLASDLLPDGCFGVEWLIIARDRALVFARDGRVHAPRLDLPLREIDSPKVDMMVGGGALVVTHKGATVEMARFTNSRAKKFGALARAMEKWVKGEEAEIEKVEEHKCPKCGLPLEKGSDVCPACTPRHRTFLRLISYLRPLRMQALSLTLLALTTTALGLVPPYLNRPLMDEVLVPKGNPRPPEERLWLLGVLALLFLAARVSISLLGALQGWLAAWLGNRITHNIRCELYGHLQFLSLGFFDKRQIGTVISRVNQDTSMLQQFLVWGAQDLANNVLLIVGIGGVLFYLNWKLALIVLIPAPFVAMLSVTFWKRIRQYMHRFFHRWGRLNAVLNESLNGLRVVKAFAQENREIARFRMRSLDLAASGVQAERTWAVLFSGLTMLIMAGSLLVWYVGGRQVLSDDMTVGEFTAFMMYVAMFYGPIQFMSMLINWSSRSLTAAERVFEVLNTTPEVRDVKDSTPLPKITGLLEFRDVTFGYETNKPVLKNINFTIAPGEMVGLVGKSGAGKTTTINLLCHFYEAERGEILIDGVSMQRIRLEDLRHQIGIVPQDTFLFSGTIAENISYAKPGATREELIRSAKVANAHDFILRRPEGYETLIGEGGQGLSSGEKQRIAIARAVLHNPRILILDEATSQVDVETEKQIQEAIGQLVSGRTTIAIAHRLSTLKNANRLIVLKDGEVAEIGTHDELLEKKGEFQRLVEMYQQVSKVHEVQR